MCCVSIRYQALDSYWRLGRPVKAQLRPACCKMMSNRFNISELVAGIISWVVVVVCAGLATYNAHTYSIDIRAAIDDERLNPNARMRKAGKIPVTESYSHVSNRTSGSDNVFQQNHMENNGFVPNRPVPNRAMPTNGFAANHPRGTIAWDQ